MKILLQGTLWLAVIALPATAGAQMNMAGSSSAPSWYVSPVIGATSGGDATTSGTTVGVSAGWKKGIVGVEAELADTSNFFEQTGFLTDRRVTTLFGNVIVGIPAGASRVKPYVLGGIGNMTSKLVEAGGLAKVDVKQGAYDVGGGVAGLVTDRVGFRADVRYFRGFGDTVNDTNPFNLVVSKLHFVRVSGGLLVTF